MPARFGFGGVATKRLSLSLSRRLLRRRFAQLSTRRLELRGEMIGARARGGGVLVRASRVRLGIPRFQLRVVAAAALGFGGVATKRLSLNLSRRLLRRRFAQLSARRLELRGEMIGARARGGGVLGRAVPARFGSAASRRSVSASVSAAAFSAAASRNSPRVASSCAER